VDDVLLINFSCWEVVVCDWIVKKARWTCDGFVESLCGWWYDKMELGLICL
jgi:hypothetical protein